MQISVYAALWFAPFVVPICAYVCLTDMRAMRITNGSVLLLTALFAVLGLIALPIEAYLWGWVHLAVVLLAGIGLNAAGAVGAGDAKFAAAAAPFIAPGDLRLLIGLMAACILAAYITHRLVRLSPLRRLAPDWQSWHSGKDFPMGFGLGGTLGLYLLAGIVWGS